MKIALLGSAPSSVKLAPFTDPSWQIWGCSPGLYPLARRMNEWFELHRWEPPVLGRHNEQVPWFTPEYVGWLAQLPKDCPCWMAKKIDEIPSSREIPWEMLVKRYGSFFFTSSLAWMSAMAIERILLKRRHPEVNDKTEDMIGYWGVDMAAGEEWGYQRAGCQYFVTVARSLGIKVVTPPESDLLRSPGLYGIDEHLHRRIKWSAKRKELAFHKQDFENTATGAMKHAAYMQGGLDVLTYMEQNWGSDADGSVMPDELVLGGLKESLHLEGDQPGAPADTTGLRAIAGGVAD